MEEVHVGLIPTSVRSQTSLAHPHHLINRLMSRHNVKRQESLISTPVPVLFPLATFDRKKYLQTK